MRRMAMTIAEIREQLTGEGQLFEMDELEIRGIPTRVWKNAPPTLRAVLELSQFHGDKTFLVYEDETLDLRASTSAAAATLATVWSSATACRRATGSPSPCATSPSGWSRSGARPRWARWSCR